MRIKNNFAPIILIIGIVAIACFYFFKPRGIQLSTEVFIGSFTAFMGLLGISIQIRSLKALDAEKKKHEQKLNHQNALAQIRMRTYDARRKSYMQLLEPFMQALANPRSDVKIDQQNLIKSMVRANIDLHLFGSDKSCKILQEWRTLGLKGQSQEPSIQKKRNSAMLIFYSRLLLSIRRDLGQQETKVNELGILRSFLTDFDQHENEFKEALLWKIGRAHV